MKPPSERARLYFMLAWFHAIVQERLRYCPLGWAKSYEFTESDLRVACDTLDTWIETVAMGRTNLPPEKVPWDALCTLFGQCIYGGKIDNDFDQRLLTSFLNKLFTAQSFEADFPLVLGIDGQADKKITMPEGIRRDQFLHWVDSLSDQQTPSWLGLPNNAEKVLLTNRSTDLVVKLLKMQLLEDDDEVVYSSTDEALQQQEGAQQREADGRPAWMRVLQNSAITWLRLLPQCLQVLRRTVENIKDPLYRYFEREVNSAAKLLQVVRSDLEDVVFICKGEKKQTNHHRAMISELAKGILPQHWRCYTVPRGSLVIPWITDFSDRVKQLQKVSSATTSGGASALKFLPVWLGGLFNPEAYITASRQFVAQANSWSLEELSLQVQVADADTQDLALDEGSFCVTGLKLQGAECRKNHLYLASTISVDLPRTFLRWVKLQPGETPSAEMITLPVYLNATREDLLFTVDLAPGPKQSYHSFYERGVALMCSSALG